MSSSVYDHPDISNDPSRRLHDHRLNRFDPDNHFSALSQFPDSPSVYSAAQFTPRHHPDSHLSTLDLEDDPRFSVDVSVYDDDARSIQEEKPHGDTDSRLSYLGPKMRFHSRAPWELDDGILEEAEPVESPKHHGFPFSLARSTNYSTGSSSPRPSFSRPSGESFRSHLMPKRSFDTINSQMSSKGALYALAQESLSSASLSRPPPPKDGLLGKLSNTLSRSRGNSSASSPSSPVLKSQRSYGRVPPLPKNTPGDSSLTEYDPFAPTHSRFAAIRPSSPTEQDVHPYANPDLMTLNGDPDRDSGYLSSSQPPVRNDSSVTVTQKFEPTPSAASRSSLSSSTGGGRNRISSIHGREISSPVAVQGTSLPPEMSGPGIEGQPVGVSHLPGWKEKFVPPAFSLISLEEARAQRANNAVAPPPADESTPTHSVADLSRSTNTLNTDDSSSTIQHDTVSMYAGRTRGRTISTGAKAKNAFQSMVGSVMTERRDSEPAVPVPPPQSGPVSHPPKPLKHKKSGFMRIFNGGKEKEADISAIPPLPTTALSTADLMPSKKSASRVPVPSFAQPPSDSASALNVSTSSSTLSASTDSSRRAPPSLYINTVAQHSPTKKKNNTDRKQPRAMTGLSAPSPWDNAQPQSAPANVTGFPTLKLRPTSGLFSSHFEDIVPDFQSLTLETPTSMSPTGPNFPPTPSTGDRFSRAELDGKGNLQTTTTSQRRITELEAQVRALKIELEELRAAQGNQPQNGRSGYCDSCGRGPDFQPSSARAGSMSSASSSSSNGSGGDKPHSVVNRPRAKTGTTSRFVNALA